MKVKGSVIALLISSVLVIGIGAAYFTYGMPFLNFMYNKLPNGKAQGVYVVEKGSPLIDMSSYRKNENEPQPTYVPSSTPEPEQLGKFGDLREQAYVDFALSPNARNILVIGADESAGLTDSIFIVSIDQSANAIKIISIPRDTYVVYDEKIVSALQKIGWYENKGIQKLNIAKLIGSDVINFKGGEFDNRGINFLCEVIEQMLGDSFHIDDYVYVDFDGFMDMVKIFGGIWLTVDENIYNQYGQLLVPKGRNYLSPKEALFYVRTRKRFDSEGNNLGSAGDSYRKELQVEFIKEMITQYVTKENISKASEILTSLRGSVYHSISTMDKLSYYTKLATEYTNKKYFVDFMVITGVEIDPFGDGASYVQIIK
ncbi:MAG: LCP family protein [Clostridia bacterium]|nr:LCP family protein [Clostridia bacterium]